MRFVSIPINDLPPKPLLRPEWNEPASDLETIQLGLQQAVLCLISKGLLTPEMFNSYIKSH
jgi:hypothetical protein